ncbi:hypothetical protein [Streptomyces sp. NPDC005989]|uniref:hypothetical protein n=1 Tax=Streptomyces sp. NPDC005989 TaxID=3156727 RepID=UPI00340EDDDD
MERVDTNDPQMSTMLQQLMDEVAAHVQDEENNIFPMPCRTCTPKQLDDLGDKIRQAKTMTPTRPHPSEPSTPMASKLPAPGVGLVDRARDFVTGCGKS